MWQDMGGRLVGRVRGGDTAALPQAPSFEWTSPPLAEVLRDMNKFSSNLFAEQLALSLAWQQGERPATADGARRRVLSWAQQTLQWPEEGVAWDRASGLSRETRLSAQQLAQVLARAWAAPTMPEFIAALPVAGVDGTLARDPGRFGNALGRAHLKTGSLRDVVALAGYVQARSGQRRLFVALINHPRAQQARPALDALVRWAVDD
jgi:D-alanyl-D-alanine carboxypeptidase/D-alanyl-D-alanine-endopeptidase (penicillin-binding protein 4)